MSGTFSMDTEDYARLVEFLGGWGSYAADVITEVIHAAGPDIVEAIDPLIPVSGRTFKGHTSGARGSRWSRITSNLKMEVTVRANAQRHYLYFPDDGSDTRRHYGGQDFFMRGAEAAAPEIMSRAVDALIESFERG